MNSEEAKISCVDKYKEYGLATIEQKYEEINPSVEEYEEINLSRMKTTPSNLDDLSEEEYEEIECFNSRSGEARSTALSTRQDQIQISDSQISEGNAVLGSSELENMPNGTSPSSSVCCAWLFKWKKYVLCNSVLMLMVFISFVTAIIIYKNSLSLSSSGNKTILKPTQAFVTNLPSTDYNGTVKTALVTKLKSAGIHKVNPEVTPQKTNTKEWRKALQSYSYMSISNFSFKKDKVIQGLPPRCSLHVVGDNLWIIEVSDTKKHIEVFTRQGTQIRKLKPVVPVYAVVEAENGDLVVASGKKGLNVIDESGKSRQVIVINKKTYWDLAVDMGAVFGITKNGTHVLLVGLKHVKGRWVVDKEIGLQVMKSYATYRVHIRNRTIYMSSAFQKSIWHYDMNGRLLHTHRHTGTISYFHRELHFRFLCGVDIYGVALVADYSNNRIQLCTATGQWKILSFDDNLKQPYDVVIDPKDNGVWIACKREIQKFLPSVKFKKY